MKTPYTFTILRYYHNIVRGEFVNIGVVLYAPEVRFLCMSHTPAMDRAVQFFGDEVNDAFLVRTLRSIARGIESLNRQLPANPKDYDVRIWTDQVLPVDDSALQFGPTRGGMCDDPFGTLDELYRYYVELS